MTTDYQIKSFKTAHQWRHWLDQNHASENGIWLQIYKKASGVDSVTYAEALDDALCYGWIDGQVKSYDDKSYLQKFTPRRKASLWSKRNVEYIDRLQKAGLMMPAGIVEVERAQSDGRWEAAYDRQSTMKVPEDLQSQIDKDVVIKEAFEKLSKSARYAILWSLQTAKTDVTRQRRMEKILINLKDGK